MALHPRPLITELASLSIPNRRVLLERHWSRFTNTCGRSQGEYRRRRFVDGRERRFRRGMDPPGTLPPGWRSLAEVKRSSRGWRQLGILKPKRHFACSDRNVVRDTGLGAGQLPEAALRSRGGLPCHRHRGRPSATRCVFPSALGFVLGQQITARLGSSGRGRGRGGTSSSQPAARFPRDAISRVGL
jgi:hypothetical protein